MRQLLFFHASWCGPCKFYDREFIRPLEDRVGEEHIQRIDVWKDPYKAERYLVDKLPTVVLLDHSGAVKASRRGAIDVDRVAAWLKGETDEDF